RWLRCSSAWRTSRRWLRRSAWWWNGWSSSRWLRWSARLSASRNGAGGRRQHDAHDDSFDRHARVLLHPARHLRPRERDEREQRQEDGRPRDRSSEEQVRAHDGDHRHGGWVDHLDRRDHSSAREQSRILIERGQWNTFIRLLVVTVVLLAATA